MKKSIAELKQDSRMLDSLMDMLSKAAYKDDKPVLDALTAAWRQGHRASARWNRRSCGICTSGCPAPSQGMQEPRSPTLPWPT